MTYPAEFDSIRPFVDEELPAAMQRIVSHPDFPSMAKFIYPNEPVDAVKQRLLALRTIEEFQLHTMRDIIQRVIRQSITEFTWEGTEYLDPDQSYLFVSNHRDIVLDVAFLYVLLVKHGHPTTVEIGIGDNLLIYPWIKRLVRMNKAFTVRRGLTAHEMMRSSELMSRYIHYAVPQKKD